MTRAHVARLRARNTTTAKRRRAREPDWYPELRYILEKYGFQVARSIAISPNQRLALLADSDVDSMIARLDTCEQTKRALTEELASDEVLLGGNTLIVHAIRE